MLPSSVRCVACVCFARLCSRRCLVCRSPPALLSYHYWTSLVRPLLQRAALRNLTLSLPAGTFDLLVYTDAASAVPSEWCVGLRVLLTGESLSAARANVPGRRARRAWFLAPRLCGCGGSRRGCIASKRSWRTRRTMPGPLEAAQNEVKSIHLLRCRSICTRTGFVRRVVRPFIRYAQCNAPPSHPLAIRQLVTRCLPPASASSAELPHPTRFRGAGRAA